MEFIKPKKETRKKLVCDLSLRTTSILEHYSKYTQYTVDEVLDKFLLNILDDAQFIEWANKQRYNKKILAALYGVSDEATSEEIIADETSPINK